MQNSSAGTYLVLVTSAGSDQQLEGVVSQAGSGKGTSAAVLPSGQVQERRSKPCLACLLRECQQTCCQLIKSP